MHCFSPLRKRNAILQKKWENICEGQNNLNFNAEFCKTIFSSFLFSSINISLLIGKYQQVLGYLHCTHTHQKSILLVLAIASVVEGQSDLFSLVFPSLWGTTNPRSPMAWLNNMWKWVVIYCGCNPQPSWQHLNWMTSI